MKLKELKQIISEEYVKYMKEQAGMMPDPNTGAMDPMGGPPMGEPSIDVGPDDIDVTDKKESPEETLRAIFDMLKDFFEGGNDKGGDMPDAMGMDDLGGDAPKADKAPKAPKADKDDAKGGAKGGAKKDDKEGDKKDDKEKEDVKERQLNERMKKWKARRNAKRNSKHSSKTPLQERLQKLANIIK